MKRIIFLILLITVLSVVSAKDYYGAELRTKSAYTYGRFDVCYKASPASGQLSTFFTYHELGSEGIDEWNEIDIEILGRFDDNVQFNTITPGQRNHVRNQRVNFDPSAGFHHYAIEWTPNYVAWFVDSLEVYRQIDPHISTLSEAQKMMMNIWQPVYEDWVGTFDEKCLPQFAYYDWAQYSSYTPGEGNYGTDSNFTVEWHDGFDDFNSNRWAKATHTWNGNNSDFIPQNVVFQDGLMILCLTDKENPGYVDNNNPFIKDARFIKNKINLKFSEEVHQGAASQISTYALSGQPGSLISVQLISNRTATLETENISPDSNYTIVASGIEDLFQNKNMVTSRQVIMPSEQRFPLFINVGGKQELQYQTDAKWKDNYYGRIGGTAYSTSGEIANTQEDKIFHTFINGAVEYKITVPNGEYDIILMMMENYFDQSGKRIFNVAIENQLVIDSLDLFQKVGKNTAFNCEARSIKIEDGIIDIHFSEIKDFAVLNGIKIFQNSTEINNRTLNQPHFKLYQNYPNPFNSTTTFNFEIRKQGVYDLSIYNGLGQRVDQILHKNLKPGKHQYQWQSNLSSGIYYYRLKKVSNYKKLSQNKKTILIK